jgi:hypothetical protein
MKSGKALCTENGIAVDTRWSLMWKNNDNTYRLWKWKGLLKYPLLFNTKKQATSFGKINFPHTKPKTVKVMVSVVLIKEEHK